MQGIIEWHESYSVGIQVIDEQHQHLIEVINTLYRELESTVGEIDFPRFFNEVVSYGDYHFQTEETFFSHYDYPEREIHLAAHRKYKEELQGFIASDQHTREQAEKLLSFLENWWVSHITGMDQSLRKLKDQN